VRCNLETTPSWELILAALVRGPKRIHVGLVDWLGGRRWVRAGVHDGSPSSRKAEVRAARDFISPEAAGVPIYLYPPEEGVVRQKLVPE
jgi:hypothetical protein